MLNVLLVISMLVLGGLGVLASAVLLVVGLIKRRRGVWVSALVGWAVCLLVTATGLLWGIQTARRALTSAAQASRCHFGKMLAGSDANMRSWFHSGTNINLPPQCRYLEGRNYSGWLSVIYIKIQVPGEFRRTLESRVGAVGRMPSELEAPDYVLADQPTWDRDVAAPGVRYYQMRNGEPEDGGFITSLALDEATGILYCSIIEFSP